jgi:GT2 family glycosyltransferase
MEQTLTAPEPTPAPTDAPTNAPAPAAVLVLGMHRSGTSALARALNLMGVQLGDDLLPPAPDNEQGFWEHRRTQFIHDRVYEALGRDWTNVSPLPERWWERADVQPYRDDLRAELRRDFGSAPLWGVKDPRLCAMLPLWRSLLGEMGVAPRCVLIVRHPDEVAASLAAREGMARSRVLLLWARSLIDAERNTRGLPRAITSFDQLLADGPAVVDRLATDLQLAWPASADSAAMVRSLRPTSRHQRADDASFSADVSVPQPVRDLYAAALAAVAGGGRLDDLTDAVDRAAATLDGDPLSPFVADLEAEHRTTVIGRNKQVDHLNTHLAKSAEAGAAAHGAYVDARARAEALTARVGELDRQAGDLSQQLAATAADRDQAHAAAEQARAAAAAAAEAHAAEAGRLSTEIEVARAELRAREAAAARDATDAAAALAAADARAEHAARELSRTRAELTSAYLTRDTLGESLRRVFRSRLWSWGRPGQAIARALGMLRVGGDRLVPLTPGADRGPNGSWRGSGSPQFLVPVAPIVGWARLRVKLTSSVGSRACLYFDTGSGFSQREHLELTSVAGDTSVDRMVAIRRPTYLIRFDPIQAAGEWSVESFSFEPQSRWWFNAAAVWASAARMVTGSGTHRPSPWIGLKLLLSGDFSRFHRQLVANAENTTAVTEYDVWRKRREITDAERARMRDVIAGWANPPTISVVLPVYNLAEVYLRACIESVRRQIYPHWQLCIADDASPKKHVRRVLAEYAAADPQRIKVVIRPTNGNISAASNSALELATGSYAALLDHDDELAEHALFAIAERLVADPSLDMVYSDEDKITPAGKHFDPFFKPDWSPEYFLACMYTCHLGVYRTGLVRQVGGWRSAFDSSQDYDLVLRVVATNPKISHVPDVLYHWRTIPSSTAAGGDAKPEAYDRARAALQSYLGLVDRPGTVEPGPSQGFHRVRYAIKGSPRVSLVIPSACREVTLHERRTWFVLECVSSIRRLSTYGNLEVIVVDNHDMSDELADKLKPLDVIRRHYTDPGTGRFNLARKLNEGAAAATGEHLVLLNDDVEVVTPGWVEAMLEFSQWPDIGAVGPQLLFPEGSQQHNGVNLLQGNPGHPFYLFPADHPGYFNSSVVHRNWSAVTGACLMTRADVYRKLGGFSESFPLNYNDVDYCLRVRELGLRIVYTPYAKLVHHESVSKAGTDEAELAAFKAVWAERVPRDPYYNPNLTVHTQDFRIALEA